MERAAMNAAEALRVAHAAGVRLTVDGESLLLEAPAAPLPAVLDILSRHKAGIVSLLRSADDGPSPPGPVAIEASVAPSVPNPAPCRPLAGVKA